MIYAHTILNICQYSRLANSRETTLRRRYRCDVVHLKVKESTVCCAHSTIFYQFWVVLNCLGSYAIFSMYNLFTAMMAVTSYIIS